MLKEAPPIFFLSEEVEVDAPHQEVEERLHRMGPELLPLAGEATASGEALLVTVGPAIGEHVLGVLVKVRLGPRWTRQGSAAIALRWEAATLHALFPVLDGTLLITPLDDHRCRLTIESSYRPPLERIGAIFDRVLLHRVAESTVHEFVRRLGVVLAAPGQTAHLGAL